MGEATTRLGLPMIAAGQAQKDMTHNEALALLDMAVQASVVGVGANEPPPDPQPGNGWVVGTDPAGAWAGHAQALASWTGGGWRFLRPGEGWSVWHLGERVPVRFENNAWQVEAPRPAIATPQGGSIIDDNARAAITEILSALRARGIIATENL
jgi:hypothetical protein